MILINGRSIGNPVTGVGVVSAGSGVATPVTGNGANGNWALATRPRISVPLVAIQAPLTASLPTGTPGVSAQPTQATQPASSQPSTVQATTASGTTVTVAGPPPATYPTDETYTDAAGNVWTYNVQVGQWQITTASTGAVSASPFTQFATWLTQQSTILGFALPNYAWTGAAGVFALMIFHSANNGAGRRR